MTQARRETDRDAIYPGNGLTAHRLTAVEEDVAALKEDHDVLVQIRVEMAQARRDVASIKRLLTGAVMAFVAANVGWIALILERIGGS